MKPNDLVVVPHGDEFFVAKVTGSAIYDPSKTDDDSAYRRLVQWLNDKKPIPRHVARSAMLSRMKIQGTSASATDLIPEIQECLDVVARGAAPTFAVDLQTRLVRETLNEMRNGRLNDYGFERLIADVMRNLGAEEVRIVPRMDDKGADLVATFRVAGISQQRVAIQAKHWKPEPHVGSAVVKQLIDGIEAEGADLGMIITTGAISDEAVQAAEKYFDEKGVRIELVDGEQFSKLIVERGISPD